MKVFVGSRTTRARNARGVGISVYEVNETSGHLDLLHVHAELINPSYLVLNKQGNRLYCVHGDHEEVSAFKVNSQTGELSFLNQVLTLGRNPVHLALDPSEQFLLVCNHHSGTVVVLPLNLEGGLLPVHQEVEMKGQIGPHRIEQTFAKPHSNFFDPSGRWVLIPDKGLDKIFTYEFKNGRLASSALESISREASGPRHLSFHPMQPWVYVLNELNSTVSACHFNSQTGELKFFQMLPSLSESFTSDSRASGIQVHASGRALYASNRGEDSIAVFQIDPDHGRLHLSQTLPSGGKTPRFFTLDPNHQWLYACNEESDLICLFKVDQHTGALTRADGDVVCGSPVCMVFSKH
jgi:6-phosphogluconolactonase